MSFAEFLEDVIRPMFPGVLVETSDDPVVWRKLGAIDIGNQGGRSAASKTLGHFGIGIKVSEDGMITGYKKELGDEAAAVKVG